MISNIPINSVRALLSLVRQNTGPGLSKAGSVVKAQVVEIEKGGALLRLIAGGGNKGNVESALIRVSSEVPLTKGQTVFLEIRGGKEDIQLKLVGETRTAAGSMKQNSPAKLIDLLVRLSESRLGSSESKLLLSMLKSLPQNMKNTFPDLKILEHLVQNLKQPENTMSAEKIARSLLTASGRAGTSLSVRAGTVLKAEVMDINEKGNALLRFVATDSTNKKVLGTTIKTSLAAPLSKGQHIYLEVLSENKAVKMRVVEGFRNPSEISSPAVPVKLLEMFTQLSESKFSNSEFKFLLNLLRSMPQNIRAAIPEFQSLEKLLMDIKQIDGKMVKAFLETSGVAFETRLKIAVLKDPGSVLHNLIALQKEGDLKSLLLKIKNLLKDPNVVSSLKQAGFKIAEISSNVDNFIKTIEFFQFTSRMNDMFCTFLPVMWDELRDGEFIFKKNKGNRRGTYTCGINLDLETLGRLSVSVTVSKEGFYVTFHSERPDIVQLIRSQKHLLEKGFASQGLSLKAINVDQKQSIVLGETESEGVNVKI